MSTTPETPTRSLSDLELHALVALARTEFNLGRSHEARALNKRVHAEVARRDQEHTAERKKTREAAAFRARQDELDKLYAARFAPHRAAIDALAVNMDLGRTDVSDGALRGMRRSSGGRLARHDVINWALEHIGEPRLQRTTYTALYAAGDGSYRSARYGHPLVLPDPVDEADVARLERALGMKPPAVAPAPCERTPTCSAKAPAQGVPPDVARAISVPAITGGCRCDEGCADHYIPLGDSGTVRVPRQPVTVWCRGCGEPVRYPAPVGATP